MKDKEEIPIYDIIFNQLYLEEFLSGEKIFSDSVLTRDYIKTICLNLVFLNGSIRDIDARTEYLKNYIVKRLKHV